MTLHTATVVSLQHDFLLRLRLTSRHNQLVIAETSLGKTNVLRSNPAESTAKVLRIFQIRLGVNVMWHLTRLMQPQYSVSIRQFRLLQSRLLQCISHEKPPCDLLMLRALIPCIRDFHPLDLLVKYFISIFTEIKDTNVLICHSRHAHCA